MDKFEKLQGVINASTNGKQVYKIDYSLISNLEKSILFTDLKMQEASSSTEYDKPVFEMLKEENDEVHYNFLSRGDATIIVPYMSEIPLKTDKVVLPGETNYITTPMKVGLLFHQRFDVNRETFSIGNGITGIGRRVEVVEDVEQFVHCIYDGYTSQHDSVFKGPFLRLANADNKYTILQEVIRKTSGVVYAKKTKGREII